MAAQHSVQAVMGGPRRLGKKVSGLADFDTLVRDGLPWDVAAHLKDGLALSDRDFARLLGISPSTLARLKRSRSRLSPAAGDRLFRLAQVLSMALRALESRPAAAGWLKRPQIGLGDRVPLDLILTEAGAREVEDLLGRLDHGVIS